MEKPIRAKMVDNESRMGEDHIFVRLACNVGVYPGILAEDKHRACPNPVMVLPVCPLGSLIAKPENWQPMRKFWVFHGSTHKVVKPN